MLKKSIFIFVQYSSCFGKLFAIKIIICKIISILIRKNIITNKKIKHNFYQTKYKIIEDKILQKYNYILNKFNADKAVIDSNPNNGPVWFCWLQGIEKMPPIQQICYERLKNITNNIHFITMDNIPHYIKLPSYIYEKFKKGQISPANFSDIIRVNLLSTYGGIWCDSRIFFKDNIINQLFKKNFYTIKINKNSNQFVSEYRWTVGFLCSNKSCILFKVISDFFNEYWKNESITIDYFLLDHIINIACKKNKEINNLFKKIEFNNSSAFSIPENLSSKADETIWKSIFNDNTSLYVIPAKGVNTSPKEYTQKGDITYFHLLLNEIKAIS